MGFKVQNIGIVDASTFGAGIRALSAFHHIVNHLAAAAKTITFEQITHLLGHLILSEKNNL